MFDIKMITTSAIVAIVIVLAFGLVGDNQSVGGATRFPNSDVTVKSLELDNGTATTSIVADKLCLTITDDADTAMFMSLSGSTGDWATSSTSCL